MPKSFYIRTFGCQMNEHDSERLAGMLVADGMEQTTEMDQADVVVLNTCCIRENADQKLYGTLGPSRPSSTPGPMCRSPLAAAWPKKIASSFNKRSDGSTWSLGPTI